MTTAYINADFISFDEHSTTYSVMIEEKGKIAYIGYSIPICYTDKKIIDLNGKAVVPANNNLISVEAPGANCNCLKEGESADFAILDKNVVKEQDAQILEIYVHGKNTHKTFHLPFLVKK